MTAAARDGSRDRVSAKDALRRWKEVTDRALRHPVVITAHGRPRHVLLAYEDYERMRDGERQSYRTDGLPADLATAILDDLEALSAPAMPQDGDTVIG